MYLAAATTPYRGFARMRSTTEDKEELDEEIKRMVEEAEKEFLPRGKRGTMDDDKKVNFEM